MEDQNNTLLADYSRFLDSTGRHLTYAALSVYRNPAGELSGKEKKFFKNHLESCPLCSERLQEVADVEGEPLAVQTGWTHSPVFRYALAATVVLAIGVSTLLYLQNRTQEQQSLASVQHGGGSTEDAARFAPNPLLESFIERTVRSASAATLQFPANGDTLTVPFTFRWSGQQGKHEYSIAVVDNGNNDVWKGGTTTAEMQFNQAVSSGLFYVKLEEDGKLVQVAKFLVLEKP